MNVAVIGSGLSGLTAGAYLAQAGHQVTVYEAYHQAGGVAAPYKRDGCTWDLGQLIIEGLAPDEPLGAILAGLGLTDRVKVQVEDRGYVSPDFKVEMPAEYQEAMCASTGSRRNSPSDKRIPRELDKDTVQPYHYSPLVIPGAYKAARRIDQMARAAR